jgi:hypothetical protein
MNVIYTDQGKPWREGAEVLQPVNIELEDAIGSPTEDVQAEWDRTIDEQGCTLYKLRISDGTDQASVSLTPEELKSPRERRYRMLRLWAALLRDRSHRHLRKLHELSKEEA